MNLISRYLHGKQHSIKNKWLKVADDAFMCLHVMYDFKESISLKYGLIHPFIHFLLSLQLCEDIVRPVVCSIDTSTSEWWFKKKTGKEQDLLVRQT